MRQPFPQRISSLARTGASASVRAQGRGIAGFNGGFHVEMVWLIDLNAHSLPCYLYPAVAIASIRPGVTIFTNAIPSSWDAERTLPPRAEPPIAQKCRERVGSLLATLRSLGAPTVNSRSEISLRTSSRFGIVFILANPVARAEHLGDLGFILEAGCALLPTRPMMETRF